MKILMICTEKLPVPPVLGGAIQTYIAGILPLVSKAHDITVLGVNHPSLPDTETIDGIHYVRIAGGTFENYREEVVRYLQNNQFDLIHIFNRPRLVLSVRNVAPHSKINLSMHNDMFLPEKINPEEASAVIAEVSNIVTISKYVGNVIRDLYPQADSKLRAIYSGVDYDRFLPGNHPNMQPIRNRIRREHGLENKTVILFSGRLSYNKGVDRLVRALPALSKKFKDLALVIVGSRWFSQNGITDYIAYVQALARKLPVPVIATGFVSSSEIQKWYAAADLFVCTSIWQEPLARVHYEAMAAGLPIVTTARGGNAEVILLGENGLIVENPENPAGFEEKITELLSNKSLMMKMGKKGRELAVSLYNWERVASEVLEVWEQSEHMSIERVRQENSAEMVEEESDRNGLPSTLNDVDQQKLENEMQENSDEMVEESDRNALPSTLNDVDQQKLENEMQENSDEMVDESDRNALPSTLNDVDQQKLENEMQENSDEMVDESDRNALPSTLNDVDQQKLENEMQENSDEMVDESDRNALPSTLNDVDQQKLENEMQENSDEMVDESDRNALPSTLNDMGQQKLENEIEDIDGDKDKDRYKLKALLLLLLLC